MVLFEISSKREEALLLRLPLNILKNLCTATQDFLKRYGKIVLMMKLITAIMLSLCLTASAGSFSQTISLNVKKASLEHVFKTIQQKSGYSFVYTQELLKQSREVTLSLENVSVEAAIKKSLEGQPFNYEIINTVVVINTKNLLLPNTTAKEIIEVLPPVLNVHGRIVGTDGKPIAGVSIQLKNDRTKGTSSNNDGYFEINGLEENAVLVISGINIESIEIKVNGKTDLGTIRVQSKVVESEEIVVNTGYWATTKKLNTGNVAKVTSKDIEKQPILNVITALQGRVPGMEIEESGGLAGSMITVRIRGTNSIAAGNDPLYVVDGIPYSSESLGNHNVSRQLAMGSYGIMSTLNTLSGSDIESIEVLKDADATAIYGSRGANGVVLITTKKGKAGKTKFDFSLNGGLSLPARQFEMLNTQEYVKMRKDAYIQDGREIPATAYDVNGAWDTTRYTNWAKELTGRPASRMSTQLSMSGGNELTQFFISGNFLHQEPSFPKGYHFYYQKASAHFNVNHSSENKKFFANFTTNYTTDFNNSPGDDITRVGVFLPPNAPQLYNEDGSLHWELGFSNPLAPLNTTYEAVTKSLNANLTTRYKILNNLELKSSFGFNDYNLDEYFTSPNTIYNPANGIGPEASNATGNVGNRNSWIIEPQLVWKKNIGKGILDVMGGATFQQSISKKRSETGSNFPSNSLLHDLRSAVAYQLTGSSHALYKYNAVYGRINYNWENKYIVNLTGRRDGSSRFGPGKQFANFGAIGAAWIFSEEQFLAQQDVISFGKIRGSYGITGNDQIGDYEFLNTYQTNGKYGNVSGMIPGKHYNSDFSWEENKKLEFGLELGLFKDRVMTSFSYYQNRSGNQLVGLPLSGITGFTTVRANLDAVVENKGLEIEISSKNIERKDFSWNSTFNFSYPKNKLVSYPGLEFSPYANTYVIGEPLAIKKLYHYTGIDPVTGIYTFQDVNKDGFLTFQDDRKTLVYEGIKYTASFGNTFSYKNFQLDVFFQYVNKTGQNFIYAAGAAGGYGIKNVSKELLNNWTYNKENPIYQRLTVGGNPAAVTANSNLQYSDATVTDASYLRLKNITLNYDIPQKWIGLKGKIFAQGQNLLTFTKFLGTDPEGGLVVYMPLLKVYNFGIQITF